ncbi:PREDICTED: putative disease resistance protein At1g50180 isoform X2 [Ipomoea nil]|uniref:putative disease resistance protein At1g50180 isoform X2 n=1 Tax=Ipomoea nil TaxID=35883 RepID=UPI0009013060|nr:PREDICTED: putative disease resistance protein At1g50180 isoform X2 [Ipomoea nil]
MAAHLLHFLKNKYINEFEASKLVRCPALLKEISDDLGQKSFKHDRIHEAIDLLYDLTNSLEDCSTFEETPGGAGGKSRRSWRGIRRDCEATKNKCCNERNTRSDLEKLKERLAGIQLPSIEKPPAETSSISVIKREGFPYFDKSEVFCFDSPFEFFKDDILPKNQHNVAMAFVGIGGSGKSTLARMIFLDEGVQKQFDNVVLWVDCSEVSDSQTKLSCITVEKFRHTATPCRYNLEEALRSLHGIIRDRRCLVVLDGLWTSEGAKTFVDVVTQQLRGTIIITTRLNDVAKDLVGESNIFYSDNFWPSLRERAKKEEGGGEEKDDAGAKREGKEKQIQEHCWLVFEETLKRKKFGDIGGIELHRDIRITELEEVIKRGSLGNPLAAKTLAEVISQRLHKTGYWAEEKTGSNNEQKVENWEFLLKVYVYDHLSLSNVWFRVLSTEGVVKEKSYYRKNELMVTSMCHPRDILRSLRDVCHVEFISMVHTKGDLLTKAVFGWHELVLELNCNSMR